jgi:hypothetical protein
MIINPILPSELTAEQRGVLALDRERWQRMGRGAHLDDWQAFAPGQLIRRAQAMVIAGTNEPKGRAYNKAIAALLERDGLGTMDRPSLTAVLWLHANPEHLVILNEIISTMTEGERSRLNSPITARQRVQKVLKKRANKSDDDIIPDERSGCEPAPKQSPPLAKMAKKNAELVFTPSDSAKDIVASIASSRSRETLIEIGTAILVWLKAHPPAHPQ